MPASPSSSLATLRPDIAGSFEEFDLEMNMAGFIGSKVAPVRQTSLASGNFGRVPLKELLNRRAEKRDIGGYQRSSMKFGDDSYTTQEYGLEEVVDEKQAAMYKSYFELEVVVGRRCYHGLLASYEQRVADLLTNTSLFEDDSCEETWLDHENATPIVDIEVAATAMRDRCGMYPNTLIITRKQYRNLRHCAEIIERLKYWGGDDPKTKGITSRVLADMFDVQQVLIANAVRDEAAEGQDASLASIWNEDRAILALIQPGEDIQIPTAVRTFHWTEDSDLDGIVESYRDERERADVIRCRHQTGEKVMYQPLVQIITGVGQAVGG